MESSEKLTLVRLLIVIAVCTKIEKILGHLHLEVAVCKILKFKKVSKDDGAQFIS